MPYECLACDSLGTTGAVAEQGVVAAVGTSFVTSILVGISLNVVYSLINMIQLYVYLPLFNIEFPANLSGFLKFFMGLAAMDLFTNETIF